MISASSRTRVLNGETRMWATRLKKSIIRTSLPQLAAHASADGVFSKDNRVDRVFSSDNNHLRYHASIANLTPADVYFGRGQTILLERERIKRKTIQNGRLLHNKQAAKHPSKMRQTLS